MSDKKHSDREHARFPWSAAHRWLECEGSIALSESIPGDKESSPAAKKGTLQHEVNEKALDHFLEYKKYGNETFDWTTSVVSVPEVSFDRDEAIGIAEQYVKLVWEKVLEQSLTGKAYGLEEKWCLDEEAGLWGTCDFWAVYIDDRARRRGVIVDYKNGHHVVSIAKNPQLMGYALSLLKEIRRAGKDLDVITTAIIQPNASCEVFREQTYTVKQLLTFEKKIYKKIANILAGKKSKFHVGEWCTFCPAMAVCETYKKDLEEKQLLPLLKDRALPDISKIPDETLATIALNSDQLSEFIKAVNMHIINRHQQGKPVAGCKVVSKPGKRSWIDDEDKAAECLTKAGIKEPWRKTLITMTAAEKLADEKKFAEAISPGKESLIIVPVSDPRGSAASSAELLK